MKPFLKRFLFFILILALPVLPYLYYDPFKVLYHYDNFYSTAVDINRDYVSTETFIKNNKKYNYDSFIFGSSRTVAFRISSWQKYLNAGARPYKFDAYGESIYGIYIKIKYLHSIHAKINNALVVICTDATFGTSKNLNEPLTIKHPLTSGESSLYFQKVFFSAYLNPKFLYRFYSDILSGKKAVNNNNSTVDSITNDLTRTTQDSEIKFAPKDYYAKKETIFYTRTGESVDNVQIINSIHIAMLKEIVQIFKENNTNFKVVISPLYDQKKYSERNMKILRQTFGSHLYDFSGKNTFTDSKYNYYEASHYIPAVGDSILSIIYNPSNQ